jgi:hypothetical protein
VKSISKQVVHVTEAGALRRVDLAEVDLVGVPCAIAVGLPWSMRLLRQWPTDLAVPPSSGYAEAIKRDRIKQLGWALDKSPKSGYRPAAPMSIKDCIVARHILDKSLKPGSTVFRCRSWGTGGH